MLKKKALIISGFLYDLSDNIIPFLDKKTDVYIHTWDVKDNKRWINKLKRYKKYCNELKVVTEEPKFETKLYSYFYSTWKAVNIIEDIDKYKTIIKFKPNLNSNKIKYKGAIDRYFQKAAIQSRPLLDQVTKEECIFGSIYYRTLDERLFTGYSYAFKKAFKISEGTFKKEMLTLNQKLILQYRDNYEGSIFWSNWFENRGLFLILDTDLSIPNNK